MSRALWALSRNCRYFAEKPKAQSKPRGRSAADEASARPPNVRPSEPKKEEPVAAPTLKAGGSTVSALLAPRFAADQYRDSLKVVSQQVLWTYTELQVIAT